MAKQIKNFSGLFGEQTKPFESLSIHYEPLQKRSSVYDYEITEHLHTDLVQFFFINEGGGWLLSMGKKIILQVPCVLIIPSNVLHGFVFQTEVKGGVFTLPDTLFHRHINNAPGLFSSLDQLQQIYYEQQSRWYLELMTIKDKMIEELQHPDKATEYSLRLLFQSVLINLFRSRKHGNKQALESDDRTLNHFQYFKKLIKEHVHEGKSIQFFARKMNLTPVHLNRICRTVSQKSALQIVHDFVVYEAKKYLKGTNCSIAEIAYLLDFKDPAHFSKFFKKKVGMTPSNYRCDELS